MNKFLLFVAVILLAACTRNEYITYQMQRTDSTAHTGSVVQREFDTLIFTHFQSDTLRDSIRVIRAHHTHTVDTILQVQYVTFKDTTSRTPAPASATISKLDLVAAQIASLLVIGVILSFFIIILRLVVFKRRP